MATIELDISDNLADYQRSLASIPKNTDEVKQILVFLRQPCSESCTGRDPWCESCEARRDAADAIERGDHLPKSTLTITNVEQRS